PAPTPTRRDACTGLRRSRRRPRRPSSPSDGCNRVPDGLKIAATATRRGKGREEGKGKEGEGWGSTGWAVQRSVGRVRKFRDDGHVTVGRRRRVVDSRRDTTVECACALTWPLPKDSSSELAVAAISRTV